MKIARLLCLALGGLALSGTASLAAAPASSAVAAQTAPVATVSRTTKAINYRSSGSTTVNFAGTELMSGASGTAKVESKNNRIQIDARFTGFEDSTKFGLEYLTYVLWGISPQGRAVNLGEIVPKNGEASLKASTEMQTFGMIVTAEPYYAVSQPGDEVVLDTSLSPVQASQAENIDTKYQLIGRGSYGSANTKIENAIFGVDRKAPLDLFEARNAVRIARNALADKYASATLAKADQQLKAAEDAYTKRDKKKVLASARNAVETAEEARVIAVQKKSEEDAQAASDAERKAAAEREAKARADAAAETLRRQQADEARASRGGEGRC